MRGRGWSGWGQGWFGWGGRSGRGNPYPFCRRYPWMPRWWWAQGMNPLAYQGLNTSGYSHYAPYRPNIQYPGYGPVGFGRRTAYW